MDETLEWKSFSLTHVRYPKGDFVGYVLAFISLAPFAILVSYVTLILFKRELDTILLLVGQLLNEVLNFVLKNVIREMRPLHVMKASHSPTTYGMPSNHSQFQTFFTVFCLLFIMFKLKYKPWYFRHPCSAVLIASLFAVIYSRVYLLYHFWSQCVVGIAVGSIWACIWFTVLYNFIEPNYFHQILSLPVSRFFGITRFVVPKNKSSRKFN